MELLRPEIWPAWEITFAWRKVGVRALKAGSAGEISIARGRQPFLRIRKSRRALARVRASYRIGQLSHSSLQFLIRLAELSASLQLEDCYAEATEEHEQEQPIINLQSPPNRIEGQFQRSMQ